MASVWAAHGGRWQAEVAHALTELLPGRCVDDIHAQWKLVSLDSSREASKRELTSRWRKAKSAVAREACEQILDREQQLVELGAQQARSEQAQRERTREKVAAWREAKQEAKRLEQREAAKREEAARREARSRPAFSPAVRTQPRRAASQSCLERAPPKLVTKEDRARVERRGAEALQAWLGRSTRPKPTEAAAPLHSPSRCDVPSRVMEQTARYIERARALGKNEPGSCQPGNFAHQAVMRTTRSCPSWRAGFGC